MNKHISVLSKILFLATFSICYFRTNSSQASTLILEPSTSKQLISVTNIFNNRIKIYRDRSIAEIIQSRTKNTLATALEPSFSVYSRQTKIELLAVPEVPAISNIKTTSKSTKLISNLNNSLSKINWHNNTFNSYDSQQQPKILVLSQAEDGNVYRDIYDFEVNLFDDYLTKSKSIKNNAAVKQQVEVAKEPNLAKYNSDINKSRQSNLSDRAAVQSVNSKLPLNPINASQNNLTDIENLILHPTAIATTQSYGLPESKDIAQYQINISTSVRNRLNVPKTKEQQQLKQKLAEQQKKLAQQRKELRKKIEREYKKREQKRKKEAIRLQQKRQEKLRKIQEKQRQKLRQLQEDNLFKQQINY